MFSIKIKLKYVKYSIILYKGKVKSYKDYIYNKKKNIDGYTANS